MLNRSVQPVFAPQYYKTYFASAPIKSHWREARCEEVNCKHHANGWFISVLPQTTMGQRQEYLIKNSGRNFIVSNDENGATRYTFPAGQQCFESHKVRTDRPAIMGVREGDFRGNPRGGLPVIHTKPEFWAEDFATHQSRIANEVNKG